MLPPIFLIGDIDTLTDMWIDRYNRQIVDIKVEILSRARPPEISYILNVKH